MKFCLRITLESKEDVVREIEINSNIVLSDLHYFIIEVFGLDNKELASFYTVDNELELIEEIPLFSFEDNTPSMENIILNSLLIEKMDKLLYVFDYMKMWRFLVELIDIEKDFIEKKCTFQIGKIPNEAPEIIFSKEKENDFYSEEEEDEYY